MHSLRASIGGARAAGWIVVAESLLVGIDLGTTVLKTCLFRRRCGSLVAQASARVPLRVLANGGREQDAQTIERMLRRLLGRLRKESGGAWRSVDGVGVASQGGSSLIVTRSGNPLTPLLLWNDGRAQRQTIRVRERYGTAYWRRLALREVAPAGLARLLWLKEHAPSVFNGGNLHAGAGDFLFHLLTEVWRQEGGSAAQIGPYNARTGQLDAGPLRLLDVPLSFFPPLRRGHSTAPLSPKAAAWTGLRAGTPVAGPYIDQEAGYLCARAAVRNPLHVSLGTAWVGNFSTEAGAGTSPMQLVLPGYGKNARLVIQPLLTGNIAWEWGLDTFIRLPLPQALKRAEGILKRQLLPMPGLHIIPWITQPNPYVSGTSGGGMICGAGSHTTPDELVRALAAGMAFEFRRVFSDLLERGSVSVVVLSGGAAKASFFRELFTALVHPKPLYWQRDGDLAGARGALTAFSKTVAKARVDLIPTNGVRVESVMERYNEYTDVFGRICGDVTAGRPYRLKNRRRRVAVTSSD
jgi:sugar (pentulose or hexulose) kinase